MNVRLSELDREIRQLEQRIADDRAKFVSALSDCGQSVRETVSSPKSLLAVAAVGFVAGKFLFRPGKSKAEKKAEQRASKTGGVLGLVAAGLSLLQPGYGAGGVARWAAQQFWEYRKKKQPAARRTGAPAATVPRGGPTGEMPAVRMPPRAPREASSASAVR
ncbi:MAG: hypothetical protein ACM3SS_09270 [Rhodospirillaceae bacterium]